MPKESKSGPAYYLFTFRSQITEQDLFENFLTIFIPILKKFEQYSYSVENDSSLQKHLHCIFLHQTAKDYTAMSQLFNQKIFNDFRKALKYKQTNDKGYDNQKVKKGDFLKLLGYVNKETQCLRREYNFTNEKILEGVNYYYTHKHIEKSLCINDDITLLTIKNCYAHIRKYCEENNYRPADPFLKMRMQKQKFAFRPIGSIQTIQEVLDELDIIMNPTKYPEGDELALTYDELKADCLFQRYKYAELSEKMKLLEVTQCKECKKTLSISENWKKLEK